MSVLLLSGVNSVSNTLSGLAELRPYLQSLQCEQNNKNNLEVPLKSYELYHVSHNRFLLQIRNNGRQNRLVRSAVIPEINLRTSVIWREGQNGPGDAMRDFSAATQGTILLGVYCTIVPCHRSHPCY